jgi:hypothetical protein
MGKLCAGEESNRGLSNGVNQDESALFRLSTHSNGSLFRLGKHTDFSGKSYTIVVGCQDGESGEQNRGLATDRLRRREICLIMATRY